MNCIVRIPSLLCHCVSFLSFCFLFRVLELIGRACLLICGEIFACVILFYQTNKNNHKQFCVMLCIYTVTEVQVLLRN